VPRCLCASASASAPLPLAPLCLDVFVPLCLLHALACHALRKYNAFGQVTSEYQEHSGAVNTSTTLKVGYAYATGASNHVRRTQTVYPNGRILHSGYDSGLDDVLCRVSYLADDNGSGSPGQHLAEYDYLGASPRSQGGRGAGGEGIVRVTYPSRAQGASLAPCFTSPLS